MKLIRQSEATECGLASVCMVANEYGHDLDLASLRRRFNVSMTGASLTSIMQVADSLGLATRPLRCEPENLKNITLPAILHWDLKHFVVLARVRGEKFQIFDPAQGERWLSAKELSRHFTGVALEFEARRHFKPYKEKVRARLTDLWSRIRGGKRAIFQVFSLSIIVQIFALIAPFFIQTIVDDVIVNEDLSLLLIVAIGFGALFLMDALTQALRSVILMRVGQSLSFQMTGNILRHLMRLPMDYFEKRHMGDITSRIGSTRPIQQALTQSVISSIIDGFTAITTVILIYIYSPMLATISVAFVILYTIFTLIIFPIMRQRQEALITAQATEQSYTLETIRANRSIKLFGREAQREAGWQNRYAEVVNSAIGSGNVEILKALVQRTVFSLQHIIIVYLGVRLVLSDEMSVGALLAFLAYRQQFSDRIDALITRLMEFRMLGLHLERLADIVYTEREDISGSAPATDSDKPAGLELKNVTFRYGSNEQPILSDLDFEVAPGEMLAITGPSGGGKTTLMKLMLGLLRPEEGVVAVDGVPIQEYGLQRFRSRAGIVMQDDTLLTGTIADNISFFDPEEDMSKIEAAAKAAQIHYDIIQMPMGYRSMIGDMGSALSGGQRQRIMIARALYRDPVWLFLDEGTANLDVAAERAIAQVLVDLPITRVVIAHRPELISRADRVVSVHGGAINVLPKAVKAV